MTSMTSIEEREAARRARREAKADRVEGWAGARLRNADAAYAKARQTADMIPMGQPILAGHHSEGRHRRDLDRMNRNMGRSVEDQRQADAHARRAAAIRRWEEERLTAPVTLRRIAKLEAERRRLTKHRDGKGGWTPSAANIEHLAGCVDDLVEEVAYWRAHLAELEAAGVKLWGPDDFAVGDRVRCPHPGTVVKVNAKTLKVRVDVMPQFPDNIRYDKVVEKLLPEGWHSAPDPMCVGCGGTGWVSGSCRTPRSPCGCVEHTSDCEPGICVGHEEEQ